TDEGGKAKQCFTKALDLGQRLAAGDPKALTRQSSLGPLLARNGKHIEAASPAKAVATPARAHANNSSNIACWYSLCVARVPSANRPGQSSPPELSKQ